MKKTVFSCIMAIAAIITSCSQKGPEPVDSISVNKSTVSVDYTEQEVPVEVTASGAWTLEGYSKWVKADVYEGSGNGKIVFKIKKNETGEDRSYTMTLVCGKASTEVKFNQAAEPVTPPEDMISLDKASFEAEGIAGECKVKVTSTKDWTLTKTGDWASVDKTSGKNGDEVTITFGKNEGEAREASFTFSIGEKTASFKLTQATFVPEPDKVEVNPTSKNVTAAAGNFTATVTSTDTWTLSCSESWISTDKTTAGTGATVTVSYTANTEATVRTATITFTCGTATAELKVSQNPESAKEPLSLKSGTSAKNKYYNKFDSARTHALGGSVEWEIVDNDQEWTATLSPVGQGATLTYDTTTKKVKITVDAASGVERMVRCWTVTVARPADTQPLVMCVYQQEYVKNSKPTLCTYEFSENTIAEGTYVISTMDSGNTKPYCLWNGISSNEARTYDLQCFLWTRAAGDEDPASFWYPDLGRISAVRAENLYDIKAKGDGTYTIRPVGNSACGLGEVDGKLMVAAECANTGWRITKGNYGWNFQCGSKYLVVQSGTPETGTSYKSLGSCTASNTLKFGSSASATSTQYIRLFRAAYADTHAGDKDSQFTSPDTTLSVAAAGSSESVTIYTTPSWTASSNASWVSVDKTSGTGVENTLKVTTSANTTGAARSAVVSVTSNGYTCKITVNQSK